MNDRHFYQIESKMYTKAHLSIVKLILFCQPTQSQTLCSTWKQGFGFFGGNGISFTEFCLSNTLTYFKLMNNLPQFLLVFESYNFYLDTHNKQHETYRYLQHIFDMIDTILYERPF